VLRWVGRNNTVETNVPARFKPTIEHFFYSLEGALALLRRNRDVVDLVRMNIGDALDAGQALQLLNRTNADNLAIGVQSRAHAAFRRRGIHLLHVVADPQWNGRAPVPVARHIPIPRVREPVAESVLTNILGHPCVTSIKIEVR
jgi:hypothetical protein